jgi:hypothetical protein
MMFWEHENLNKLLFQGVGFRGVTHKVVCACPYGCLIIEKELLG